jgi:hypothetical protein
MPEQFIGDYPLVVEFPYEETQSRVVNCYQIEQGRRQHALLLSLFVFTLTTTARVTNPHWGIVVRAQFSGFPRIEWGHEGIAIERVEVTSDSLTPPTDPLIPLLSAGAFYGRRGIRAESISYVPESLGNWRTHFTIRSVSTKKRFRRIAYRLGHAHYVYPLPTLAPSDRQVGSARTIELARALSRSLASTAFDIQSPLDATRPGVLSAATSGRLSWSQMSRSSDFWPRIGRSARVELGRPFATKFATA